LRKKNGIPFPPPTARARFHDPPGTPGSRRAISLCRSNSRQNRYRRNRPIDMIGTSATAPFPLCFAPIQLLGRAPRSNLSAVSDKSKQPCTFERLSRPARNDWTAPATDHHPSNRFGVRPIGSAHSRRNERGARPDPPGCPPLTRIHRVDD